MFQQNQNNMRFVNRKEELKALDERFGSNIPEFIIMYGRRRVGKTELAIHSIKGKPSVYFLAEEKKYMDNLNEMKDTIGNFLSDEEFKMISFENWVQLFKSFLSRIKERTVVVIDEFPYLVKGDAAVPSEFQKIWDMHLSKSDKIVLILIGSSVSMMEKLLGNKSPLFGRRTAQLEIKPLNALQIRDFLPDYNMEDCLRAYGCADGIPLYLKQFNGKMPVFENIRNMFFRRDAILYNEADMLLRQEFREPANYFAILKAISLGNTRQNEIINYTNIDKSIISKYLQNLEEVRVIKKEYPITDRKEKRKNTRYDFLDNYFKFWFRFIYPSKALIESGSGEAFEIMKADYDRYMGRVFEKVSSEFLWSIKQFSFTKIGRQWGKFKGEQGKNTYEIDIVALNEQTKEILFCECKWQDKIDAKKILQELKEKAKYVEWNNDKRKESYAIFAKSFKERIKEPKLFLFDLKDMEKMLK